MILAGEERERGRDGDDLGALDREDSVSFRESGGRSRRRARAAFHVADNGLVAGLLGVGLAIAMAANVDVEHVDLPVDGDELTQGRAWHVLESFSRPSRAAP